MQWSKSLHPLPCSLKKGAACYILILLALFFDALSGMKIAFGDDLFLQNVYSGVTNVLVSIEVRSVNMPLFMTAC